VLFPHDHRDDRKLPLHRKPYNQGGDVSFSSARPAGSEPVKFPTPRRVNIADEDQDSDNHDGEDADADGWQDADGGQEQQFGDGGPDHDPTPT